MDQMADEMTLRGDVKDKRRVKSAEESSSWVREERIQTKDQVGNWRLSETTETEPGDIGRDTDAQQSRECDNSSSPLFSWKSYLRRSSSTDSLSSSQQSNTGVDCAGIILNCLFCRFYDMVLMLPDSANHCCPNHKQGVQTVESPSSNDDDPCIDMDCGLLNSCQDASDCLELAMEVSEICYH